MATRRVNDQPVETLLMRELDAIAEGETEIMFNCISKAAKHAKKDVMELSPKKSGDYRKGWAIRTKRYKHSIEALIYNRTKPGLTWLLENGHMIRNKYGKQNRKDGGGSRTTPVKHISIARDNAEEYLIELLTENL